MLIGVDAASDLGGTEIFGPVAAIQVYDDGDDLRVGMVGLNSGTVSDPATPFGGVKESGLGRVGIDEFLDYELIGMPVRR